MPELKRLSKFIFSNRIPVQISEKNMIWKNWEIQILDQQRLHESEEKNVLSFEQESDQAKTSMIQLIANLISVAFFLKLYRLFENQDNYFNKSLRSKTLCKILSTCCQKYMKYSNEDNGENQYANFKKLTNIRLDSQPQKSHQFQK